MVKYLCMKKEFLECGKILSPHGVRGLCKVESWCDSPAVLAKQKRVFFAEKDGSFKEREVLSSSLSGELVLMHIEGVCDREVAQGLKNTTLYLKREDIPLKKGSYFIADIIGLPVYDIDTGDTLGKVTDIQDVPQGRMYYIEATDGRQVLVPDVREFIKKIDIDNGVYLHVIPGFFD